MSNSSLEKWDREVAPNLQRIGQCTERIEYWAQEIEFAADLIKEMPEFETKAEESIKRSIEKLVEAYASLKLKRRAT